MKETIQQTPPILVTGVARSGTSMVAGVVHMCGAFGGQMSGPNHNNRKGMFENAKIRNEIVKPFLREIGVDPKGQYPLPDITNIIIPRDWRRTIERVMIAHGYKDGPWMYKGPKMSIMWPIWHYAFPNAKWIIVRRRTGDIVESCMKTGFMTAFNDPVKQLAVGAKSAEEGWKWWVNQHIERFVEMISDEEGPNCKIVWPHRMVNGDYKQLYETIDWLGLKWNSDALQFIDPQLWHSRKQLKKPTHGVLDNR